QPTPTLTPTTLFTFGGPALDYERRPQAMDWDIAVDPFEGPAASARDDGRSAGLRNGYAEGWDVGRSKGWEIGLELGYVQSFVRELQDGCRDRGNPSFTPQPPSPGGETQDAPGRRTSHRLERCLALARDVLRLIDEFPDPDSLLSQSQRAKDERAAFSSASAASSEAREIVAESIDKSCAMDGRAGTGNLPASDHYTDGLPGVSAELKDIKRDKSMTGPNDSAVKIVKPIGPNRAEMTDVHASLERIRSKFKLLCVLLKTKHNFDLKKIMELGSGEGIVSNRGGESIAKNTPQSTSENKASNLEDTGLRYDDKGSSREQGGTVSITLEDLNAQESDW
ncbi:hypothetical protein ACHAWF_007074, partial [Thalassiosira exigua]